MQKKKLNSLGGLVYSTNPDLKIEDDSNEEQQTIPAAQQKIKVLLDRKQRAGKSVTLVEGFIGKETDMQELGKKLKAFCGTGGSVKDGEILIQGDNRNKVLLWLQKNGYTAARKV